MGATDAWLSQQHALERVVKLLKAPRSAKPTLDHASIDHLYEAIHAARGDLVKVKASALFSLLLDHARVTALLNNQQQQ